MAKQPQLNDLLDKLFENETDRYRTLSRLRKNFDRIHSDLHQSFHDAVQAHITKHGPRSLSPDAMSKLYAPFQPAATRLRKLYGQAVARVHQRYP